MIKHLHAELTHAVIAAAFEVHKLLGAGFSEDVYRAALAHELKLRQIPFEKQVNLPVIYKNIQAGDYVADFIVDGKLVLIIKAVSALGSEHQSRALHLLAASGLDVALLLNFGTAAVHHQRVVR